MTQKALMRLPKRDLVRAYISLLDMVSPASPDASTARTILQHPDSKKLLTATQELGLLRRWFDGSKHLIGCDS
jgi:hypothetical protein